MTFSTDAISRKGVLLRMAALGGVLLGLGACASTAAPTAAMRLGSAAYAPVGYDDFCRRLPAECAPGAPAEGASAVAAPVPIPVPAAPDAISTAAPPLRPEAAVRTAASSAAFDWNTVFDERWRGIGPGWAPAPVLAYTPALMHRLTAVDRDINARIAPASDQDAFGAADRWALPLSEGLGSRGNCKHYVLEKRRALIGEGVPTAALSIAVVRTAQGVTHAVLLVSTDHGEFVLDNLSPWVVPWSQAGYTWLVRQAPGQAPGWFAVLTRGG